MSKFEIAIKIFKMIDKDNSGYITADEVPELLKETYRQMGIKYEPSEEDVQVWFQMTDTNKDGKVTLQEYEELLEKSLKKQGY